MRSLPQRCFGPSGLPCIFATTGGSVTGFLVKQISTWKYIVSDGSSAALCKFARTPEEVADISNLPPFTFTIELTLADSTIEHIFDISETRCSTIQGTSIAWNQTSPTNHAGTINPPSLGSAILLETGSYWLLEDGSHWELETP